MDRPTVLAMLRARETGIRKAGVARLYLFGSVARREKCTDSDVDLFFGTGDTGFSPIEPVDVQDQIGAILGTKTDVMTRASLHPMLRSRIETEAPRVF